MFEYFYHEIMRRTIIGFGSLFNDITIKHTNDSDSTVSNLKVPLAYGPVQKFLARLEQQPNLSKSIQITLPRMSFEMTGLNYDSSRKSTTTQTFLSPVAAVAGLRVNENTTGKDCDLLFRDTAESFTADVWNILSIRNVVANIKLLQFKITNNSGGESTMVVGIMRIV